MASAESDGNYSYINEDVVVPDDDQNYEELRPIPQPSGQASTQLHSGRRQPNPVQVATSNPGAANNGCSHPLLWGWAMLIAVFIIAATLVALLVFFLTSTNTSAPTVNRDTTSTATTRKTTPSIPNPKNCKEVFNNGGKISRVYSIYPDGQKEVKVFCEQTLDGGGWTVFQRRLDGSVDFYLEWYQYRRGFGVAAREYWVGNDNLHTLTANQDQKLKVELQYGGQTLYADYAEFWVDNEDNLYTLHVDGFSEANPPGDSLTQHNGQAFSTKDRDNDTHSRRNCAQVRTGAWWYLDCYYSNLNGLYNNNTNHKGVNWNTWKGDSTSLSATRMMVKPR